MYLSVRAFSWWIGAGGAPRQRHAAWDKDKAKTETSKQGCKAKTSKASTESQNSRTEAQTADTQQKLHHGKRPEDQNLTLEHTIWILSTTLNTSMRPWHQLLRFSLPNLTDTGTPPGHAIPWGCTGTGQWETHRVDPDNGDPKGNTQNLYVV